MPFLAPLAREKLLLTARSLPAAPQVLAELGEMLQDVNTGLEEIADLLKQDAALAARIIRISNSSALGGGNRIGDVGEAVNRVGFGEVYRLVGLATTSRLTDRALNYYLIEAEPLRQNMLYTALASECLAQSVGLDARHAYTAGLMRPLGMMVLDRIARDLLPLSEAFNEASAPGYAAWEGNVFSICNTEVTGLILGDWKFPTEIVGAVREHYLEREADLSNKLACVLNLAGSLAARKGLGLVGESIYWEPRERKMEVLGLAEDAVIQAGADASVQFERLKHAL